MKKIKEKILELIPERFRASYWIIVIKRRRWVKVAVSILAALFFLSLAVVSTSWWYVYEYKGCWFNIGCLVDDQGQLVDLNKLGRNEFKKASYVYGKNGEVIGIFFDEIRDPVRIGEVPKVIQKAFIAAEDKRFYSHDGIDLKAIASAGVGNFLHSQGFKLWLRTGGASTITQQLVRIEWADTVVDFKDRAKTLNRKIKEARMAIQLERLYSKDQILEHFLNVIWLGQGANGVAPAAYRYFGKDIRKDQITIREAAILAALNKKPIDYSPAFRGPVQAYIAKDRYNFVLTQMRDNGFISESEYQENLFKIDEKPEIEEVARLRPWKNPTHGYSNRLVKEFLMSRGYSNKDLMLYGGLRIHTTIDPKIQRIASAAFEEHLELLNEGLLTKDRINGAFVIIEIATGNILALSGGNNFEETQYNRVMASRSAGSGFKPFTYAAAIEHYQKDFFDKICNCRFSRVGAGGARWAPQNFREENPVPYGQIDMATGLIRSVNLATLNLAMSLPEGARTVVQTANSMGVWGKPGIIMESDGEIWFRRPGYNPERGGLEPLLPTVIGGSDVNMLELANAYTVFFRGGVYLPPTLIREVRDAYGEEILFKANPPTEKAVLSKETANKVLAMMRAVTKVGTAKISMRGIEQQVACKTGTSDGPKDVSIWCGTPEMVIAFRFGHDDFSRIIDLPVYMARVSGSSATQVTGGWVAGILTRRVIDSLYADRPKVIFSPEVEAYTESLVSRYK